jgi:DNA-binding PadR family transcriptional regulator
MEAATRMQPELKKGTAEVLILSLLEDRARHGYELAKLIEKRSRGVLEFHVASLYPMLYRLERRGWIEGRWLEKAGQRRRRFYKLTLAGRRAFCPERVGWREFTAPSTCRAGWKCVIGKIRTRHLPRSIERRARAGDCREIAQQLEDIYADATSPAFRRRTRRNEQRKFPLVSAAQEIRKRINR